MKRRLQEDDESSEDESRFMEAAVTPDFVLKESKIATKSLKGKGMYEL